MTNKGNYIIPGYNMPEFNNLLSDPEARIQSYMDSSLLNPFHSWRADQMPGEPDLDGWVYRGTQPMLDLVPASPDLVSFNSINTEFKGERSISSLRNAGLFESLKGNCEQYLRDFLESPVSGEIIKIVTKAYSNPNQIRSFGVEKGDGFYAAIFVQDHHYHNDGQTLHVDKGTLLFNANLKAKALDLANNLGFKGEMAEKFAKEYINSVIAHEVVHNYNESSESRVGEIVSGLYSKMAKRYEGTEKGEIYQAVAKWHGNYSKAHSGLMASLRQEAIAKGCDDENMIDAYVGRRLEQIEEDSGLEDIVEDCDEVSSDETGEPSEGEACEGESAESGECSSE